MLRRTAISGLLVSAGLLLLPHPAVLAQLPQRCLLPPSPPDREALVKAATEQLTGAEPPQIIVDSVDFDNAASLPPPIRQLMIAAVRGRTLYDTTLSVSELNETGIRGVLQKNGYFRAESSIRADVVSTTSAVEHINLTIRADTGSRYYFGTLQFRSASVDDPLAFSDTRLRQFVHMHQGDIFDSEKLRQAFDDLKNFYGEHGYIDFTPTPDFDINDEAKQINLTLVLDQMQLYRVDKLEFVGDNPAVEQAVRQNLIPGEPVDSRLLKELDIKLWSMIKNPARGLVTFRFDFRPCPAQ